MGKGEGVGAWGLELAHRITVLQKCCRYPIKRALFGVL